MMVLTVTGNVGKDAEVKNVGGTTVAEFSVASKDAKGKTTWTRACIWGERGQKLAPHITKGSNVTIIGQLDPREYDGKDGKAISLDVRVDSFAFGGGPKQEGERHAAKSNGGNYGSGGTTQRRNTGGGGGYDDGSADAHQSQYDDSDLPF